ncbi:thiol:disulfide interchange protein DsbA/DsbL [Kangiella koreensis]|uniref:Thiol:disulfide interchange protein n=1 Tax=Kangiella koreensis (strain DSM 16069 / JCM 12317 / KCTC 12182 / SW-125) TaxID=523791 RepID=C7RAD8_KANKD|nr:thiol:disulfide interchange protein DsbA/DsbL [Kangiella koreensis]ACV28032.1 DSBA oxidoreductase [Kangiella koreensis DSM 16069]
MKLKTLFSAALALLALTQVACAEATSASQAKEGKDFSVISGAKGVSKPEVMEFFSYTCPHCYNVEGFLHKWEPTKPAEVSFKQVPVFLPQVAHLTYGYYTAEVLGVLDKVHPAIFNQWHAQKKIVKSKEELVPIFEAAGVTKEEFEKAYSSFAVENKVQHAKKLAREFKVSSFPMFVVNQKYKIESYEKLDYMLSKFPIEQAQ